MGRVKDKIGAEDLKARLQMTLGHEVDVLEHQFNRNHVDMLYGLARFVDAHTVEVDTEPGDVTRLTAKRFLISTATKTFRPDNVPFNSTIIVDSDEFLELARIARSLIVVGAGDTHAYKWRHLIENYFAKIKEFRGITTRYDKTDCSYTANWFLIATLIASQ